MAVHTEEEEKVVFSSAFYCSCPESETAWAEFPEALPSRL